jgi:protein-disulfide isomerase
MRLFRHAKAVLDVISTLLVIVAASMLIWKVAFNVPSASRQEPIVSVKEVLESARVTNVLGHGHVAIVEFSDFECPFCGGYARDTFPTIKRSLIDSGEVRYIALNFPLTKIHSLAFKAAEAAECAAQQGRFWEMYERLFANVKALVPTELPNHASALRLDEARFNRCLEEGEMRQKVHADRAEGERLRVEGTPAFFVGTVRNDGGLDLVTRINGIASIETFKAQVAELSSRQARRW